MKLLIKNGRIIDPISNTDEVKDLMIEDDKIVAVKKNIEEKVDKIIDAKNCWVVPGLIDIHVHLREPGFEDKETISSGSQSAAKGGFTTICCMPNTNPVIDNKDVVKYIQEKANKEALVNILPIGAITKGQEGRELAAIEEMMEAGICGISEDGKAVMKATLMEEALEVASKLKLPVFSHCEDHDLSNDGVMNEGDRCRELGLKGISPDAEEIIAARDIFLAQKLDVKLHLCHISTQGTVEILRQSKKRDKRITAEVCPHHFTLTEEAVTPNNTNTKMNPPLRTYKDIEAIKEALRDGTIDIIATDHAPHHEREKNLSYVEAPFGIVGLETAVPLVITELVDKGILTPIQMIEKMSTKPAALLGLDKGELKIGKIADVTIINPYEVYDIDINKFASKGKNSPFHGKTVKGKVNYTIVAGKLIVENGELLVDKQ
ncbi:dihydroorotase [Natronincola ferrireducens]|uniref:Dihydroorotase n=1 Tax=Natronincola ferrireducens TaxID=393762 RepID=A0A1G9FZE8_9FIRM|nr:dihydroorotase [Natronincola ferrireducens]SDK93750.1 dihydroorotase [Natronincola ferrireducens]